MPPHFRFADEKAPKLSFQEQKKLLKAFLLYYPRYKKLLFITLLAAVAAPAAASFSPVVILEALKNYLPSGNTSMVLLSMLLVVFLLVAGGVFDYISMRWGAVLGYRMEADMRQDLFRHLLSLPFSYYDSERSGTILSRMTNDLTTVSSLAHRAPEILVSAGLRFLLGVAIMMWINWRLACFILLPAPFILLWMYFFQNRMRNSFGNVRKSVAELNACVDNGIKGIRETQSFTNEKEQLARFSAKNSALLVFQESLRQLLALFHIGMRLLLHGYTRVFIAIGVVLVCFKMADTAELIVFFMYSHSITHPLMMMVELAEQYQQGMAAFERFREIMSITPAIKDNPGCLTTLPEPLKGQLELRNVSFKYPSMKPEEPEVLKNISLLIAPGKKIALVGESGAGKTTLGALISRFYEPVSGEILLDGRNINTYSLELLRSNIGTVSQSPWIFDGSIKENISVGRPGADDEAIIAAARFAGIHDFITTLPDQYESHCGENGVKLSGGQRQRIAIARVFLKNPPILILDEATSSLDNESETLVQQAFDKLGRNRTSIVIAHRLSTIQDADCIYCMRSGKIVESGSHSELLARKGYYYALYSKTDRHSGDA
ncbi:MAG: ABC transporter ATP-binding protein [Lentisphaerae bacterium]|nr:ABC transporter ATP-binding protein [Lentisphaerota bacterium]